ncbi:N-acetylmuramoyl-L-alanine amidase [Leptospira ilyithenensis]|uniref:N-acetylmuramoyl-L-alanine amidase n=1 Tax=Leptospira ilyithenensis TaxID=2484901 RepID=A0A4R9LTC4_9LEPT|nr:N-acetylmuramoyl-L-alanine amidase [Leptospira ilyithenensis]
MSVNLKKRFLESVKGSKSFPRSSLFFRVVWHNSLKISLIFLIFFEACAVFRNKRSIPQSFQRDLLPFSTILPKEKVLEKIEFTPRTPNDVTALVLHSTDRRNPSDYLRLSIENGFMIHLLVDKSGKVYAEPLFLTKIFIAAPGIDRESIHIAYEGTQESLLANPIQLTKLISIIDTLSEELDIPKTNQNVITKKGIFSHNQTKRRFGGFVDFSACGGELAMQSILKNLGGQFFEEDNWVDRFESGWSLKKESKQKLQESFHPTNGRGITKAAKIAIPSLEKDESDFPLESYRVRYTHRGKINPTCIVLHYTAIPDYFRSLKTLENRNLTASIMVDKDGKAYQLVDVLEDRAAAATGTNDNCIQIEIVALDTAELLVQTDQIEKIKLLVTELCKKYKIPFTNEDIASFSGIFSHTQAKKKWGGSIFLNAKDFDPGEEYMELILKSIDGKYFSEPDWKKRKDSDWAILYRNFQP